MSSSTVPVFIAPSLSVWARRRLGPTSLAIVTAHAAFPTASGAVSAAIAVQDALDAYPWEPGNEVRVRIGMHTGEAELVANNYLGLPIHVAERICSSGHGRQILVSATTATASQQPASLPARTTPFIGRASQTDELNAAFDRSRVVTLTGPGGVGKTRLATEFGMASLSRFYDGRWLVDLASLGSPDLVLSAIASALGIDGSADRQIETVLVESLGGRARPRRHGRRDI